MAMQIKMEKHCFNHTPVLLNECLEGLNIKPNGIYVDGTMGGAGHSSRIVEKLKGGKLIGIDKDDTALAVCKERLKDFSNVVFVKSDFKNSLKHPNRCFFFFNNKFTCFYKICIISTAFST